MGNLTLTDRGTDETILKSFFNETNDTFKEDFVGRNASGVPTSGQNLGTVDIPWGTVNTDTLTLNGVDLDPENIGGGGSLDFFFSENFETTVVADLTKGKDPIFDNGGVFGGTLLDETINQIAGSASLKYTTHATIGSSDNDYFYLPTHILDDKQKGQDVGITFYYNSSIADDLMEVVIWNDSNNTKLNSILDVLKLSSTNQRYSTSVFIPSTCNAIKVGFHHVGVSESSKVLIVDDIEISTNPFVYKNLIDTQNYRITQLASSMANLNSEVEFNLGSAIITDIGPSILKAEGDAGNTRTKFVAQRKCSVDIYWVAPKDDASQLGILVNGVIKMFGNDGTINENRLVTGTVLLNNGDFITLGCVNELSFAGNLRSASVNVIAVLNATAATEHLITPAKSNMSDWESYTPTFTGFGTVTGVSIQSERVGETLNIRGRFTAGTVTVTEARIDLPAGLVSKSTIDTLELAGLVGNTSNLAGSRLTLIEPSKSYFVFGQSDSTTAALNKRTGADIVASSGTVSFTASIPIEGWSSDASFLAAIPIPKIAYIKDVKASGTNGGGSTATFTTRDLNTLSGDASFVSLASSQFTISPGTYSIMAWSPVYESAGLSKIKLRNITDSSDDIIGDQARVAGSGQLSKSFMEDTITIKVPTVFEVQQRSSVVLASTGFGVAASFGVDEIYTQVKITKLR